MKKILLTIGLILSASTAWSAAMTTIRSGNWNDATATTPWTALTGSGVGGVPGDGDTVTISSAVVVDGNTTVGTSAAAGTAVITVTGVGSLSVNSGVSLTVRGDTVLADTVLTLAAGSSYYFDSSLAAGTPRYKIRISNTNSQTGSKLVCNGVLGNRVTIGKAAGSGNGLIGRGINGSLTWSPIRATYTDFSDLGSTSTGYDNDAIESKGTSAQEFYFNNCTFVRCGRVMAETVAATEDLVFTFNSFSGCIQASGYMLWINPAATTTGLS